jgi:hypothetical protein
MRTLNLLLIALVLAAPAFAHAEDKPKSSSKGKNGTGTGKAKGKEEEVIVTSTGFDTIGSMIPEGIKNLKVRIPGFDAGRNTSLIVAKSMTRVNPQEIFAEDMTIHLYHEQEKDNVRVDLRTGTYHMDTKLLTSKERSKVTRSDFQIEGDTMVFDTTTSQGKMAGRVHMIIYDSGSLAPKPASPAAAPKPTTPDTAPAEPQTK